VAAESQLRALRLKYKTDGEGGLRDKVGSRDEGVSGVAFGGCVVSLVDEERVQRSHTPRDEEGSFSTTRCCLSLIRMTSLLHKNVTRV
jgi:hypothetical protein